MGYSISKSYSWVLVLAAFLLSSCATSYVPNSCNVPLFNGKNQFLAGVGSGSNSLEYQVAYSVSNHFALMTNGSFRFPNDEYKIPKRNYFEGGIGFFNSPTPEQVIEVYGGYGAGFAEKHWNIFEGDEEYETDYQKVFLQFNIGYKSTYLEGSFSPRVAYIPFTIKTANGSKSGQNFFFEPAATLKGGNDIFKVMFQLGISRRIGVPDVTLDHKPLLFSFGMQLTLGTKQTATTK